MNIEEWFDEHIEFAVANYQDILLCHGASEEELDFELANHRRELEDWARRQIGKLRGWMARGCEVLH